LANKRNGRPASAPGITARFRCGRLPLELHKGGRRASCGAGRNQPASPATRRAAGPASLREDQAIGGPDRSRDALLPDIQAGLEILARAIRSHSPPGGDRSLTISVTPSFASKWLLPRLADFTKQNPDIDLGFQTVALADLERDGVDLAIRLGRGPYPNVRLEALFGERLTPLCSPNLVKPKGRLRSPGDLRKLKLIHDTSIPGDNEQSAWRRWLDLAGATAVPHHRGLRFSLAELAMQAAIDGAGVVPVRTVPAGSCAHSISCCPWKRPIIWSFQKTGRFVARARAFANGLWVLVDRA